MESALWFAGSAAACVGLLWLASRIEPHWVSKDGHRFLCNAQPIDDSGRTLGRWREMRVTVMPDGRLHTSRRAVLRGKVEGMWRLRGKSADPPSGRAVYLLGDNPDPGAADMLALRLPAKSRAIAVLDALIEP